MNWRNDNKDTPPSGLASKDRYSCALHEVSNALTVVLGWLERAQSSEDRSDVDAAIAIAREHAQRGRMMARRTIGADTDDRAPSRSAAELAEFAAASLRPQCDSRGVEVTTELGPGTEVALEDDGNVLQILTNLLLNALHFAPESSTVELGVSRSGEAVTFAIQDSGPGISTERRDDLFTSPMSTRQGGAGIGLPHSRQLARSSGGELVFVPDDRGARFELAWPIHGSTGVRPSIPAEETLALEGARILVLEDDPAISSLVELSFESRGAEVITVSGPSQLNKVLDGRPLLDMALLDLSPVAEDLLVHLDRLQAVAPDAPVILMSGQPTGVPSEAEGRFAAWVRKPFDMEQLIATVAGSLRRSGSTPTTAGNLGENP